MTKGILALIAAEAIIASTDFGGVPQMTKQSGSDRTKERARRRKKAKRRDGKK